MPPRNPELPEGTDHIINGAMETGTGTGGPGTTTGGGGGSSTGFIGSGDTAGSDTGGTTLGGASQGSSVGGDLTSTSGTGTGGTAVDQLKDGVSSLKSQATDKVRAYAEDGKERASAALEDFSKVVSEAADSIDERLGDQYGVYARRAADAVSGFATTLREKEVDELYDNARDIVRKSPVLAIGTAAAVGFALVRLIKSGMPDEQDGPGGTATTTVASDTTTTRGTGGTAGTGTAGTGV